jgi:cellulose synthase/poly-beta-1,6-N-acetylglucosamine synthase-like glycosyltransferase
MVHFLNAANYALFFYYLAGNLVYLACLVIALKTSAAHQRRVESYRLEWITHSPLAPPITLIAPAHNEEKSIRVSVRNLLEMNYPELELVVVNDGSKDQTFTELHEEFRLRPVRAVYVKDLRSAPVRGFYRSDVDPRLLVIDKEAGGSKADAVNAGINAATSPYVCIVDSDSVLEKDALLRIMIPVLADHSYPKRFGYFRRTAATRATPQQEHRSHSSN